MNPFHYGFLTQCQAPILNGVAVVRQNEAKAGTSSKLEVNYFKAPKAVGETFFTRNPVPHAETRASLTKSSIVEN